MSHYSLAVVLPEGTPATTEGIQSAIECLLAPYDENLEVDPYKAKCGCVGSKANAEARRLVLEVFGPIRSDEPEKSGRAAIVDRAIRAFGGDWDSFGDKDTDKQRQRLWSAMMNGYSEIERHVAQELPNYDKPDPECDECKGSGSVDSTYNPKSKWDYWVVGGRWGGYLSKPNTERCSDVPASMQPELATMTAAGDDVGTGVFCLSMMDANPDYSFFAALTPDGEWHEKGRMGWFACVSEEKSRVDWRDQLRAIFASHQKNLVVCVDCHI